MTLSDVRRGVALVLLACGALGAAFALLSGYALASWSLAGGGTALALGVSAVCAAALSAAGVLLWGRGRWRAVLGRVAVAAGAIGVTVAASLPFVMRSEGWRAMGGPAPSWVSIAALALSSVAVAAVGGALAAGQPGKRSFLAERTHRDGPAPMRDRDDQPSSAYGRRG